MSKSAKYIISRCCDHVGQTVGTDGQPKNLILLKKFILLSLLFFTLLSCEKNNETHLFDEENYINEFFRSEALQSFEISEKLNSNNINFSKTFVKYKYNENNVKVPIVYSFIYEGSRLLGALEGVRFNKELKSSNFNVLLRDFSKFDNKSLTGLITLSDLTDKIDFLTLKLSNGVVKSVIKDLNSSGDIISLENRSHPMDLNKDGNVSFSECYKYANNACSEDPECFTMCYGVGDGAGWVVGGFPQCQAAIGAACIYTSLKY